MAAEIPTLPDPTYVTVDLLRERTTIEDFDELPDEEITQLIQIAEGQIDDYCGRQEHHAYDDNEHRVFPRPEDENDDGDVIIPPRVTAACILQVEWLYTQWWIDGAAESAPVEHKASQISIGGDGSYSETRIAGGTDLSRATLCEQAQAKLSPFRSRSGSLDVSDISSGRVPLSSRDSLIQ